MAEAIAAFGLAAGIVQFIDFGSKVLSVGYGLQKQKREGRDFEQITRSLQRVTRGVTQSLEPNQPSQELSQNELDLRDLATRCAEVAEELLGAVAQLDPGSKSSKRQSFRAALRSVMSEHRIEGLRKLLGQLREEIVVHILACFRDQLQTSMTHQSELLNKVDVRMQGIGQIFLEFVEQTKKWQKGYENDRKQWQVQIIDAIHQDGKSLGVSVCNSDELIIKREEQLQVEIIGLLRYPEMADRQARIADAHAKTFQWIYTKPGLRGASWTDFTQWLQLGSSLYWITGKAGSGKSTLMKYVYQDARTLSYLNKWAGEADLVTAAYFFWNSGTSMQMSQRGLLQSMLHQILTIRPRLISRILPQRWEAYNFFGNDHHPIDEMELRQAFRLLAKEDASVVKFCLFVDGLDEFDGDHANLIDFMRDMSDSKNVKVCVSSRPWVVFQDAFKHGPSLMLQDLTYPDVMHFISSMFSKNVRFAEFRKREPEYADKLFEDIGQKSAGVFLWVHLVVHSLLTGLANGDRVSDLQRRLALLPPDLEELYRKMLDSLDPFYLEHASQLFELVKVALEPPSILFFSFADEDPDFYLRCEVEPFNDENISSRVEVMKRRLNSCCKGLLEVAPDTRSSDRTEDLHICATERTLYHAKSTVQYLHRTVKDFLAKSETWEYLMGSRYHDYDPYLAMSKAVLIQLKVLYLNTLPQEIFWKGLTKCLNYAQRAQPGSGACLVPVLDELDQTATQLATRPRVDGSTMVDTCLAESSCTAYTSSSLRMLRISQLHWTSTRYNSLDRVSGLTFLSLAVRFGLHVYVKAKLMPGCLVKQDTGDWPLLFDAISVDDTPYDDITEVFSQSPPLCEFPSTMMVQLLLDNGADPNHIIRNSGRTLWEKVLWQTHNDYVNISKWDSIIRQFLKHGANPRVASLDSHHIYNERSSTVGDAIGVIRQPQQLQGWFNWARSWLKKNEVTPDDILRVLERVRS